MDFHEQLELIKAKSDVTIVILRAVKELIVDPFIKELRLNRELKQEWQNGFRKSVDDLANEIKKKFGIEVDIATNRPS